MLPLQYRVLMRILRRLTSLIRSLHEEPKVRLDCCFRLEDIELMVAGYRSTRSS